MTVPKYIKKMILDRERAQGKSNKLQSEIERWFDEHNIEVEWSATHSALYVEPIATRQMYFQALRDYEER